MRNFFTNLCLLLLGIMNTAFSQTVTDTITYPLDNATDFLSVNSSRLVTDVGQFFSVNGTVQVTGVQIAFGVKRQVNTSDVYNIRIFNVGADSLPTGTALATTTYTTSGVDTAAIINTYTFATPVSVTNRFAIAVEVAATTKNDTNLIIINGDGDGLGFRRSLVRSNNNSTIWQTFTNTWFKAEDAFLYPGTQNPFDADFLIFPIYQFQQNPFAQFSATPLTANIGQTVTFNNNSTGSPTPTYNWSISPNTFSFTGGTNATSTNPQVQFSTAGTYSVTLTATNSNGSDQEIKNTYITVLGGGGGTPSNCDTLFNFGIDDTLRIFTANGGYQSGHNGFGDISKAEFFNNPYASAQLQRAFFFFGVAKAANPSKTINIRVWNNNGLDGDGAPGAPGTVLFNQAVPISTLPTQGNAYVFTFPSPISVTNDFYVGINFAYAAGDTVALYSNDDLETLPGTAWEQFGNNDWYAYSNTVNSWGTNQSLFILADLCQTCPTITATSSNVTANSSCTTPNGSFSVNASGGATPYQFSRTAGVFQPSNSFTGLQGGNYTVTVRDANGCTGTVSVTINTSASTPSISLSNVIANTNCAAPFNGGVTAAISGGVAPYNYSITGPNGYSQTGASPIAGSLPFTGLAAGNYNGTVTGANGCSATATAVVPNNAPSVLVTQQSVTPNTSCTSNNGAFTVIASGGTAPYTYAISGGNNQTGTFSNLAAATYTVTATSSNGCTGTLSITVTNNAPTVVPNFSNVVANSSCSTPNGSFALGVTGGTSPYNYSLSNNTQGALSPNPLTVNNLSATSYTVTVTDANGCSGTATTTVANNAPSVTVSQNSVTANTVCGSTGNGTLSVTASNGIAPYTYSISGSSNQSGTFNNLTGGTYVVTAVASNGCSGTLSVVVPSNAPTLNVQVTNSNPNTSCVSPNGSVTISATGGTAQYSYNNGSVVNQTGSFNNLSNGTFIITATDANGCTGTVNAVVANQANAPTPAIQSNNANTACSAPFNGSFTLTSSGGSAPYTYATSSATNQTGAFNTLAAGSYIVTVTGANGCSTTTTVNVANLPNTLTLQTSNNNPNTSCGTPNGSFTVLASNGSVPYTYNLGGSSNGTGVFSGLNGGTYNVTVTDAAGCTGTASVSVSNNQPTLNLNASSTDASNGTAADGSATVSASGGTGPYTYAWNNGGTTSTINNVVAGVYNVTVTDANGCSATASVTVSFSVSIADNYALELNVFPNPTKNNLNVNVVLAKAENITVELFNVLGEKIATQELGKNRLVNHTIGMQNFADGVYIIKVNYGSKTSVKRVVLNK